MHERHRASQSKRPRPGKGSKRKRKQQTFLERSRKLLTTLPTTIEQDAKQRPVGWPGFVLLLTTSMAIDAVFRAGFVPGLFNGVTFLNFIFHEFGHLACRFTPQWIQVAAGTVAQLLLPIAAVRMFVRQGDLAACCFAFCWLAISLMHTADYMSDARSMSGDMTMSAGFWSITSGQQVRPDELVHDWNYLLRSLGLLQWDTTLAACVRILAGTISVAAVAANAFMAWTAIANCRT